jgi:hypothetical protein
MLTWIPLVGRRHPAIREAICTVRVLGPAEVLESEHHGCSTLVQKLQRVRDAKQIKKKSQE